MANKTDPSAADLLAAIESLTEEVRQLRAAPQMPQLLTIKQAADVLAMTERPLRRLVDQGLIRAINVEAHGSKYESLRIAPDDLAAFIESRRTPETVWTRKPQSERTITVNPRRKPRRRRQEKGTD